MKRPKETDVTLGTAKVSSKMQISIITQIRPYLDVKPGDRVRFRMVDGPTIVIEKET